MDIPAERWYQVIKRRRSRRRFDPKPIEANHLSRLSSVCAEFRPFQGARASLGIEAADTVFKGIIGSYGKIKDAPAFIAFIGDMNNPNVNEQAGYTGEGIILEAEALNLASCWVGGFFQAKVISSLIKMDRGERVLAVTPIGYAANHNSLEERVMTGFGLNHRRKPLSDIVTGPGESEWATWVRSSLEAAILAPSAINRQPWGFDVDGAGITVFVRTGGPEFKISKRLDCGIAMLHIEAAARSNGIRGKWEFLEAPRVARFTVDAART